MRLSLKAKVLSLAVVPVLLFAVVISLTTVWILQGQARNEVDETRQRLPPVTTPFGQFCL